MRETGPYSHGPDKVRRQGCHPICCRAIRAAELRTELSRWDDCADGAPGFSMGPYSTRRSVSPSRIHQAIETQPWPPVEIFSLPEQTVKKNFSEVHNQVPSTWDLVSVRWFRVRYRSSPISTRKERHAPASTELRVLRHESAAGLRRGHDLLFRVHFLPRLRDWRSPGCVPQLRRRTRQTPDPPERKAHRESGIHQAGAEIRWLRARCVGPPQITVRGRVPSAARPASVHEYHLAGDITGIGGKESHHGRDLLRLAGAA